MTTAYDTFTTRHDLASRVAALNVRELARVIGRTPERDDYPDMTDRELARAVIAEAIDRVLAKNGKCGIIPRGATK